MKRQCLLTSSLMAAIFLACAGLDIARADVSLVSPDEGEQFGPCSLVSSYQPTFSWGSTETFASYNIRISLSPTDFRTDSVLLLSARVPGTQFEWRPEFASWLRIARKSYNAGETRELYWKIIGNRSGGGRSESEVRGFRAGPAQPVTILDPLDGATLDSAMAPTVSFDTRCNTRFVLEFSLLPDFSDPDQVVEFSTSRKDPNADPVKEKTLSWDQWTAVKRRLGAQGFLRVRAWDGISRETVSEAGSVQIHYRLVGDWDVQGTETIRVDLVANRRETRFPSTTSSPSILNGGGSR